MLVLTRQVNEEIVIGDDIRVTIVGVSGGQVRIGIVAPRGLAVHRKEIYDEICRENVRAAQAATGTASRAPISSSPPCPQGSSDLA